MMKTVKMILVVCFMMIVSGAHAQMEILQLQMQMNQQQAQFNRQVQQWKQQQNQSGFDLDHSSINGVPAKNLPQTDNGSYNSNRATTNSTTSRNGGYTRAQIQHQADVEARAYEYYRKDPNRQNHDYWQSQKQMTQFMQQHFNGR